MPVYLIPVTACNSTKSAMTETGCASCTRHGDGGCSSSIQGVGVAGEAEGEADGQEEKCCDGGQGGGCGLSGLCKFRWVCCD